MGTKAATKTGKKASGTKAPRKKASPASKRKRLVKAAAQCFRESGLRATTIKAIAERADVPIGNVYYYFKTKEDFALAVVSLYATSQADQHRLWTERDPKDALDAYVTSELSSPAALSRYGGAIEALVRDCARESSPALDLARALLRAEEEFVRGRFSALDEGSESPERPRRLAQWLVMSVRSVRAYAHLTGNASFVAPRRAEIRSRLEARLLR